MNRQTKKGKEQREVTVMQGWRGNLQADSCCVCSA